MNILAWRFFHKRLPTKVNLVKRGVTLPSVTCSFCNYADENEDHLFSDCRLSIKILKEVCNWWGFDDAIIRDNCSILDWDSKLNLSGNKRKAFMGVVYVFLWLIWSARNGKVFDNSYRGTDNLLFNHLQAQSFFWIKHRSKARSLNLRWDD